MSNTIQLRRRINGATGSPAATGIQEGEVALNFPKIAGSTDTPELYAFDGTAWRRVNPAPGAITQQAVNLNTPGGADVGAAATAWIAANAAFTGDIVLGTFGAPAQAYILTNAALPGTAASWTSLGGAVSFANAAEIHTGTDTLKAINSAVLRGETVDVPDATPANDGGKLIRLNATGKIDAGFLVALVVASPAEIHAGSDNVKPITSKGLRDETLEAPSTGTAAAVDHDKLIRLDGAGQIDSKFLKAMPSSVRGAVDATKAPPAAPTGGAYKSGDILFANKAGAIDAGWTGATGNIRSGDAIVFDGTNWHVLANETDLNAYVPLAGTAMMAGSVAWAADQSGNTVIDGKNGNALNLHLDCGTY